MIYNINWLDIIDIKYKTGFLTEPPYFWNID